MNRLKHNKIYKNEQLPNLIASLKKYKNKYYTHSQIYLEGRFNHKKKINHRKNDSF